LAEVTGMTGRVAPPLTSASVMVTAIQPVAERVKLTPPMVRFESVKFYCARPQPLGMKGII